MKRKPLLAGVALLAAIAAGLGFFWPFGNRQTIMRLPAIVEIQQVRLGSKVGGRVLEVVAKEGSVVSANQALVIFDVPELEAQRDQAQAKVQAAEADYEKAKNGPRWEEKLVAWAAVDAAKARLDRLVAGWREEEIRQAKSDWETSQADLKQSQEDYERIRKLYQQQSASRADYDAALGTRDRALGRAHSARARYEMYQRGSRQEDKDEARAEWRKAKAQLDELLKGTRPEEIAAAKARLEDARGRLREIQVNLREAVVVAPKKAVVEVVSVRKGDIVPPNQPIVRILYAEDLWVKAYVPEPELGKVRLGEKVEVTIDTYPKRFTGSVDYISPVSEFTPRNVQSVDERHHQVFAIKIRVDNSEGIFHSGMAADVFLPVPLAP